MEQNENQEKDEMGQDEIQQRKNPNDWNSNNDLERTEILQEPFMKSEPRKPNRKKGLWITIISIAGVCAIAGIVLLILFLSKQAEQNESEGSKDNEDSAAVEEISEDEIMEKENPVKDTSAKEEKENSVESCVSTDNLESEAVEENEEETAEEIQGTAFSKWGITYWIPAKFDSYAEESNQYCFANEADSMGIIFSLGTLDNDYGVDGMIQVVSDHPTNVLKTVLAIVDEYNCEERTIAGYQSLQIHFTGYLENGSKETGSFVFVFFDSMTYEIIYYGYSGDYSEEKEQYLEDILESATKEGNTVDSNVTDRSGTENNQSSNAAAVDPDLVAFLDEYEDFIDSYVTFYKSYLANPMDTSVLSQYSDIMNQYSSMQSKLDAWDSGNMSSADLQYYTEVVARCEQKVLSIYQ